MNKLIFLVIFFFTLPWKFTSSLMGLSLQGSPWAYKKAHTFPQVHFTDQSALCLFCGVAQIYTPFFNIFTRGQFWPSGIVIACVCVSVCPCVYQSLACPHDNSSAGQARITKFGSEIQSTLVKMPIVFGGDHPWHSRSNLTWKSNFTSFWACPHDNFSPV